MAKSKNYKQDINLPRETPGRRSATPTVKSAMAPVKRAVGGVGAVKAGINRLRGR